MSAHKPSTLIFKGSLRKLVHIARTSRKSTRDRLLSSTRANSMLPISSLPPELLMMVFSLCVPDELDSLTFDMGWISFSHVCRQWRTIALSCVELWSSIIFSKRKWTKLMLKRSKAIPLTFRVNIDESLLYERMIPVLRDFFPRLQVLHVAGSHSQLQLLASEIQTMCKSGVVPRLETLIFNCTNLTDEPGCWIPSDIFQHPSSKTALSASRPPYLRHIEFNFCALAWDSPCYENLIHLSLDNIPELQRPTLLALGAMFYAMPDLEVLSLGGVDVDGMQRVSWKASLPRLRKLSITDTIKGCSYVLAGLSFPSTTAVDVSCFNSSGINRFSEEYLLRTFLVPTLFARQAKGATGLSLSVNQIGLQVNLVVSLSDTRPGFALAFRLVCAKLSDLDWRGVLTLIFRTLSLHEYTITDLHLVSISSFSISQLAELWSNLCVLNDLCTLHIHREIPPLLFEYMLERSMYRIGVGHPVQYPVTPYGALPTMGDFLPNLRSIHFIDVNLYGCPSILKTLTDLPNPAPQEVGDDSIARDALPSATRCLRAFLWARKVSRLRIQELVLEKCRTPVEDLCHFRFFCDVECDEKPEVGMIMLEAGCPSPEEYSVGVYAGLLPSLVEGLERTKEPPAGQIKKSEE